MDFIMENWPLLVTAAAIVGAAAAAVARFVGLPTEKQLAKGQGVAAVGRYGGEKDLGGGTGKLKLRQVYDLFVQRFPWLAKAVSFELFQLPGGRGPGGDARDAGQ